MDVASSRPTFWFDVCGVGTGSMAWLAWGCSCQQKRAELTLLLLEPFLAFRLLVEQRRFAAMACRAIRARGRYARRLNTSYAVSLLQECLLSSSRALLLLLAGIPKLVVLLRVPLSSLWQAQPSFRYAHV